jgi:hypothetical protein
MLARRLQFDGVAHNAFEPNQFGGVAQRSTEDAGIYLTHLVRAGWARGLQTSVVAFDIAQFFPSLNHEVLFDVFSRMGFPAVLGPFLRSYLVGRRTTYKWDSFTSEPFAADVGVGQGSAMSPVLSALYLTLIMRRFRASDIGKKVDLMSYVDDGSIVAQSRDVRDNLPLLKEAYGWLFRAFESLGLVLEHDKSEVFHFLPGQVLWAPPSTLVMPHTRAPLHCAPSPFGGTWGSFLIVSSSSRSMRGSTLPGRSLRCAPWACLAILSGASSLTRSAFCTGRAWCQSSPTAFACGTSRAPASRGS